MFAIGQIASVLGAHLSGGTADAGGGTAGPAPTPGKEGACPHAGGGGGTHLPLTPAPSPDLTTTDQCAPGEVDLLVLDVYAKEGMCLADLEKQIRAIRLAHTTWGETFTHYTDEPVKGLGRIRVLACLTAGKHGAQQETSAVEGAVAGLHIGNHSAACSRYKAILRAPSPPHYILLTRYHFAGVLCGLHRVHEGLSAGPGGGGRGKGVEKTQAHSLFLFPGPPRKNSKITTRGSTKKRAGSKNMGGWRGAHSAASPASKKWPPPPPGGGGGGPPP